MDRQQDDEMDRLRGRLSRRISEEELFEITFLTQGLDENPAREALYRLLFDADKRVSDNATWVFAHFDLHSNQWLYDKRDALTDEVLRTSSTTKRRLLLTLLLRQPFSRETLRIDFLNFCLKALSSADEPAAIRVSCMKLAYGQCRFFPELLSELRMVLEGMETDVLSAGVRTARRNILQAIMKHRPSVSGEE